MKRHPPPDEKKKRSFAAPTAGPLQSDKLKCLPQHTGSQTPLSCPPFIFAQHMQNDKANEPGCFVVSVQCDDNCTPADSPGQISIQIVQNPPKTLLTTLAVLMIRERQAKDEADRAGDGDAWLKAMDMLWLLHAEYNNARGMIEHGP